MNRLAALIQQAIGKGLFPGAVILAACEGQVVLFEAFGNRTLMPEPAPMTKRTIFDLASLTKVFATTLAMMKLVDEGRIHPGQTLSELIPSSDLGDKKDLTLRLLLTHSSGLPAHRPFYEALVGFPMEQRKRLLREKILKEPLVYEPGQGNVYSDLGFMLLEWVIEKKTGTTLKLYVEKMFYRPLGLKRTFFRTGNPGDFHLREGANEGRRPLGNEETVPSECFAPTEYCPWRKRLLIGEVDDENAFALGGYSGHAGLFSTADDLHVLADMLRGHYFATRADFFKPATIREFFRRQDVVQGSDWALGWDTRALAGSSAGRHFSRNSVGHTGFTGTSIWMDLEKDVTVIFLTNRVHPTRDNTEAFKAFRPRVHDTIMEEMGH